MEGHCVLGSKEKILTGGRDWNTVQSDGVAHILAQNTTQAEDGTLTNIQ